MNSVFSIDNFKNNPIKHTIPVLLSFTFLCILIDMISGFQGTQLAWSDIWHHRAVLLALSENPLSPGNPHIASDVGSRSYTPIYLTLGWLKYYTNVSVDILLSLSILIAFGLNYLGSKRFLASLQIVTSIIDTQHLHTKRIAQKFVSNILKTVENSLIYKNSQFEMVKLTSMKKCVP